MLQNHHKLPRGGTHRLRHARIQVAEDGSISGHVLAGQVPFGDYVAAITAERVDVAGAAITFEGPKKRRRGMFRAVPIPPELATMLNLVFGLRKRRGRARQELLWP